MSENDIKNRWIVDTGRFVLRDITMFNIGVYGRLQKHE